MKYTWDTCIWYLGENIKQNPKKQAAYLLQTLNKVETWTALENRRRKRSRVFSKGIRLSLSLQHDY